MNWGQFNAAGAAFVAGQQINQKLELGAEEIAQAKQQTAAMQMSNMAKQQQQQNQQQMAQWLKANADEKQAAVQTPAQLSQLFDKGAMEALKRGDWEGASKLQELAKGKLEESKRIRVEQAAELAQQNEDIAKAALEAEINPSQENAMNLVKKAVALGEDPSKIPPANTPAFSAWVKGKELRAGTAKEGLDALEKKTENDRKFALEQEKFKTQTDLQLKELRERSREHNETTQISRARLQLETEFKEAQIKALKERESQRAAGVTPLDQRQARTAVVFAGESVRGLDLIGELATGQTQGTFASLDKPDTILKSLQNVGANRSTPQNEQLMQTALKGLGMELAQVATVGSGRAPTESVKKTFTDLVAAQPGDTNLHTVFRIANAADFVRQRMKTTIEVTDPKVREQQQEIEKQLAKYPTPAQVLSLARQKGIDLKEEQKRGQLLKTTMDDIASGKIGDDSKGGGAKRPAEIDSIMKKLGY